jgi:hypothetical protein
MTAVCGVRLAHERDPVPRSAGPLPRKGGGNATGFKEMNYFPAFTAFSIRRASTAQ